jgi:predicted permease
MLIVGFLPVSETIKYAVFFALSMPSATGTVMFAVRFGGDADSASVMVLLSTILSIITIPLMFLLFSGVVLAI